MTNKEKLEELTNYIGKLEKLTQGISETEIYPVSFFSEAFDLTSKIQEELHEMEMEQIALFDKKIREHQAQILSVVKPRERVETALSKPMLNSTAAQDIQPEFEEEETSVTMSVKMEPQSISPTDTILKDQRTAASFPVIQKESDVSLNDVMEKNKLVDLKKAFTLNDRFRFCRELFGRDEKKMNRIISELNEKKSYEESLSFLNAEMDWNFENETVIDFLKLIERRFV